MEATMPTPLEILLDPLSLVFIGIYCVMIGWEAMFPARKLIAVPGWKLRGLMSFALYFYMSSYLPLLWDGSISRWQLFDLSSWSTVWQFFTGLLVFELVLYGWHRSMHRFKPLWLGFHQMHHSAERLDTFGAFWFSPMDIVGFTMVGSVALALLVGVDASAATAILLVTFFLATFQHMNVRTPRWLGYLVQRPESHSYHHGVGKHRDNYADIPLLDILFGTFRNPDDFLETGFYQGASSRVIDMLLMRDIYDYKISNSGRKPQDQSLELLET